MPIVTNEEFNNAVTSNGYPQPSKAQYDSFEKNTLSSEAVFKLKSKAEAAMFLANAIHETGGLVHKQEQTEAEYREPIGWKFYFASDYELLKQYPQNRYYGRGYIQLSWLPNYREASEALCKDKLELVKNPDCVHKDEDMAWRTSAWFWKARVWPVDTFEESILKINPNEETVPQKSHRNKIYSNVRIALGI